MSNKPKNPQISKKIFQISKTFKTKRKYIIQHHTDHYNYYRKGGTAGCVYGYQEPHSHTFDLFSELKTFLNTTNAV